MQGKQALATQGGRANTAKQARDINIKRVLRSLEKDKPVQKLKLWRRISIFYRPKRVSSSLRQVLLQALRLAERRVRYIK